MRDWFGWTIARGIELTPTIHTTPLEANAMNINRMTLKVEARNNRTVALNDLAYWQNRLIVLRDRFIRGSLTKADYLEYRESAKRRMAYAALMLRVAIRDIATLCR